MKFHKRERIFFFFFSLLDQQIGYLLQKKIYNSFEAFAEETTMACNYSEKLSTIPIDVS